MLRPPPLIFHFYVRGSYERWYYDSNTGNCHAMNYTGCMGNANRFMTQEECANTCKHDSRMVKARTDCYLPKQKGRTPCENDTLAKWYFDFSLKKCQPFYFSGCGANANQFSSLEECEDKCPNTFPPEITVSAKVVNAVSTSKEIISCIILYFLRCW